MHLIEIVSIACISLLLVLASYLLVKGQGQNKPFRWIGFFFLLLAINFGDGLLYLSGFYLQNPGLAGWEDALVLLYGPTLLFFAVSAADPPFKWSFRKILHLVPFAVFQIIIIVIFQSMSTDQKLEIITGATSINLPAYVIIPQLVILAHFFTYTLYSHHILRHQEERLKDFYSSSMIAWAKSIYSYLMLLFVLALVATLVQSFGNKNFYLLAVMAIVVTTIIFLFAILVKALDHPILSVTMPQRPGENSLSTEEVQQVSAKIEHFFRIKQGYSNPNLSIKDLAEQLAEPVRDVSQVINQHLANNFYDLVNGYRIEAAKHLLSENIESKLNIMNVMYEVGFNSKSSFNAQFKQKTGVTPSAYRKQAK